MKLFSNKKMLIALIVLIVLGGGIGFYVANMLTPKPAPKEKQEPIFFTYPIQEFVVNTKDGRFLKASIVLELNEQIPLKSETGGAEGKKVVLEPKAKPILDALTPELRNAAIIILSSQTYQELITSQGKERLRQILFQKFNQIVGRDIVKDVYFTSLVMQ